MKEASIGPPDLYLGARLQQVVLDNGVSCWASSSSQYVQATCQNFIDYLEKRVRGGDTCFKMPGKAKSPLPSTYRPELDVTAELESVDAVYYASLIGVL